MSRTYEIMYLLDNNAVRAGWNEAKAAVAALLEKHHGKVLTSRRWEERMLAYPIRRRRRGTYLLVHAELEPTAIADLRRELDISEVVLRYLILQVAAVPPEELELTQVEASADFVVPVPPPEEGFEAQGEPREEVEEESEDDSEDDDSSSKSKTPVGELAEEEV